MLIFLVHKMGGRVSQYTKKTISKMKSSKRKLFADVNISELMINMDQPINRFMSACYI